MLILRRIILNYLMVQEQSHLKMFDHGVLLNLLFKKNYQNEILFLKKLRIVHWLLKKELKLNIISILNNIFRKNEQILQQFFQMN